MPSLIGGAFGLVPFGVIIFLWAMTPRKKISRREWLEAIGMVVLLMVGTVCIAAVEPPIEAKIWKEFVQSYLYTAMTLSILFFLAELLSDGFFYKIRAAHVREEEAKAEAAEKSSMTNDKVDP